MGEQLDWNFLLDYEYGEETNSGDTNRSKETNKGGGESQGTATARDAGEESSLDNDNNLHHTGVEDGNGAGDGETVATGAGEEEPTTGDIARAEDGSTANEQYQPEEAEEEATRHEDAETGVFQLGDGRIRYEQSKHQRELWRVAYHLYNRSKGVRPNPSWSCSFCNQRGTHLTIECCCVTSLATRELILQSNGQCRRCLYNHDTNECEKRCHNCSGNHNAALCRSYRSTRGREKLFERVDAFYKQAAAAEYPFELIHRADARGGPVGSGAQVGPERSFPRKWPMAGGRKRRY